jgi:hypothetical protein
MPVRRFPPPWKVEEHPGGESFIIRDAKGVAAALNGQPAFSASSPRDI